MRAPADAADEYGDAARLLAEVAKGTVDRVQRVHLAIARRPFAALGAAGEPVKRLHDGISGLVYHAVRAGLSAGGVLTTAAAQAAGTTQRPGSLLDSAVGRAASGILAGAFGERGHLPPTTMTVRVDGDEVALNREALADAYPAASGHIVLFLHGLIETERWWYPRPREEGPARVDFGSRLADDIGCTPVYLRYHSGRHISTNGRELNDLLALLTAEWPATVERISIVGHSMGGLVARSAVHQAVEQHTSPWLARLTHVICLGAPHTGAPLEVGAHLLSWALRKLPESAPLGELLELRSEGIKDLRYGYLHDDQWSKADPHALFGQAARPRALVPEGARQHFFTATIGANREGILARFVGDALVTPTSSEDESQQATRHWAGGLHHFDLLHHDEVYGRLRIWLSGEAEGTAAPTPPRRRAAG